MINVLGDALAAGIMAHICRKDFAQDTGTEVRTETTSRVELGGVGGLQPTPPRLWALVSLSVAEGD